MVLLALVAMVGYIAVSGYQGYHKSYPAYPEQKTAGQKIDQAVGKAVEKYEEVLDKEQNNPHCTLSNCPISSKFIPGVPENRALFTNAELVNFRRWVTKETPRSSIDLYSVSANENGVDGEMHLPGKRLSLQQHDGCAPNDFDSQPPP